MWSQHWAKNFTLETVGLWLQSC